MYLTKMKKIRKLLFVICCLICIHSVVSQNAPITTIESISAIQGETISLDVTVANFTDIVVYSLRLDYDSTKLRFLSFSNWNPTLIGASGNDIESTGTIRKIMVSWFDGGFIARTLPTNDVLFTLNFLYKPCESVEILFNNTANSGQDCEYGDEWGDPLNDNPTATYYNDAVINCTSGLPIELLFFDAKCITDGVQLTWYTVAETNNNFFTIDKSYDMISWEKIGTVYGSGNSNHVIHYSFVDNTTLGELAYYRLKQTDYDGTSTYPGFVYSKCNDNITFDFKVFPNPANGQVKVGVKMPERGEILVNITDVIGHLIFSQQLSLNQGCFDKYIDLSSYPTGIYNLTITHNNYSKSKKFIRK